MAEQALKRLLVAPLFFFIFFIMGAFALILTDYSGMGVAIFLVLALAGPAMGLFVAGRVFPGENITLRKNPSKKP